MNMTIEQKTRVVDGLIAIGGMSLFNGVAIEDIDFVSIFSKYCVDNNITVIRNGVYDGEYKRKLDACVFKDYKIVIIERKVIDKKKCKEYTQSMLSIKPTVDECCADLLSQILFYDNFVVCC